MLPVTKKSKNNPVISAIVVALLAVTMMFFVACSRDSSDGDTVDSPIDSAASTELPTGVLIPDLRGYMREDLERQFDNLGFAPTFARLFDDSPPGTIIYIARVGQRAEHGATIEVHISAGLPENVYEPTPLADPVVLPPDLSELSAPPQVGDNIGFGGINWRILDIEDNKILLLSEFILFYQPFNNILTAMTWEDSTLRHYLNNEFLSRFSPDETARIAVTRNIFSDTRRQFGDMIWYLPGGNDTDDLIFLLSTQDVERLFESDSARRATNTGWVHRDEYSDMWWWLLDSEGEFVSNVVRHVGNVMGMTVDTWWVGVRPALWLYLE